MCAESPDVRRGHGTEAARYRHLIEHIQDAVVEFELVDGRPVVENVNSAFVEVFGYEPAEIKGDPLNEWIVPDWLAEEAQKLDSRTSSGEVNYRRVKRETATGLREFLYRGIPYGDSTTGEGGFAVYTDLTEINRNERRLQVMNRVLRHNLRNKANIISAHTTRLLGELDTQTAERTGAAVAVENAADDLETLAEEAQVIRNVLSNPDTGDTTTDCVPLIRSVAEEYRGAAPAAEIETELPGSMTVNATSHLGVALRALIDNAIEHNPADRPRVRISVRAAETNGWADIYVDDDGPRIPATERDVITGAVEITPTQHGSGLGLWLVKWTTELFGGELAFERSDLGGNRVNIRLPRR
jgi:PAS domain S-box-containing protein